MLCQNDSFHQTETHHFSESSPQIDEEDIRETAGYGLDVEYFPFHDSQQVRKWEGSAFIPMFPQPPYHVQENPSVFYKGEAFVSPEKKLKTIKKRGFHSFWNCVNKTSPPSSAWIANITGRKPNNRAIIVVIINSSHVHVITCIEFKHVLLLRLLPRPVQSQFLLRTA
jgi:hypothetical protein